LVSHNLSFNAAAARWFNLTLSELRRAQDAKRIAPRMLTWGFPLRHLQAA